MFKILSTAIVIAGLAAPAIADTTQLERALDVEPGEFTVAEMVRLMEYSGDEYDRQVQLIHKQRADFADAVHTANGAPEVTRAAN